MDKRHFIELNMENVFQNCIRKSEFYILTCRNWDLIWNHALFQVHGNYVIHFTLVRMSLKYLFHPETEISGLNFAGLPLQSLFDSFLFKQNPLQNWKPVHVVGTIILKEDTHSFEKIQVVYG